MYDSSLARLKLLGIMYSTAIGGRSTTTWLHRLVGWSITCRRVSGTIVGQSLWSAKKRSVGHLVWLKANEGMRGGCTFNTRPNSCYGVWYEPRTEVRYLAIYPCPSSDCRIGASPLDEGPRCSSIRGDLGHAFHGAQQGGRRDRLCMLTPQYTASLSRSRLSLTRLLQYLIQVEACFVDFPSINPFCTYVRRTSNVRSRFLRLKRL